MSLRTFQNSESAYTHYQSLLTPPHSFVATTNLFSVSMDLPIWGKIYKWNHPICDFCIRLLSLSIIFSFFFFRKFYFILFLNLQAHPYAAWIKIPFLFMHKYRYILFCLPINPLKLSSIQSSVIYFHCGIRDAKEITT